MAAAAPDPAAARVEDFSRAQWVALLIVVCTGFSSQMVMPLWIGAVIDDLSLTAQAAGRIGSYEFMSVAVVSIFVALRIRSFPTLTTVAAGMSLLIVGNSWAAFAGSETTLIAARMLCGIGKGLVVAITFSLVAGSPRPTSSFAILNVMYAVFATGFYLLVPHAIRWNGAAGAFLVMAGVAVLGSLFMIKFPRSRLNASQISGLKIWQLPRFGLLGIVALIILWTGHNVVWTFVERIGVRNGLDIAAIGGVLSLSAFITIAGPALARLVDTRLGFGLPMLVAIGLKIIAVFLLAYATAPSVYVVVVPAFMLLSLFITPYVLGILSLADPAGRLAAASSAAMTAGGSIGAFVGGATVGQLGYSGLSWVAGSFFLAFTIIIALIAPLATRSARAAVAASA